MAETGANFSSKNKCKFFVAIVTFRIAFFPIGTGENREHMLSPKFVEIMLLVWGIGIPLLPVLPLLVSFWTWVLLCTFYPYQAVQHGVYTVHCTLGMDTNMCTLASYTFTRTHTHVDGVKELQKKHWLWHGKLFILNSMRANRIQIQFRYGNCLRFGLYLHFGENSFKHFTGWESTAY